MTDGERREHFQPLASDEVRVPIASIGSAPGQVPQSREEKDEDALSACKSIQDSLGSVGSSARDPAQDGENQVPYPALASTVFFCLDQTTRPRSWCLRLVCNPWFEHVSMLVILLNCVTLGMFQPCQDTKCKSERCTILEAFDHFIFAFFAVEMVIKMVALGIFGQKCYLGDTWNRLDFFIVIAGMMEYSLDGHNVSLSAIRTVRVLRPLRAINRVPSMRILVTLLLDTLPMLGNVLLLCFFVFFIFGIVGVQLWAGLLRNRCFLDTNFQMTYNLTFLHPYYRPEEGEENPFICSSHRDNGMQKCSSIPIRKEYKVECTLSMDSYNPNSYPLDFSSRNGCINWNQYYNVCRTGDYNPHNGAINFDNIGYAWIAIFQVITLEGWVDIMYYVMDAHSFYNFIYFILLIIVGSFFMINLCLVVIATQFSETKQRENQLMQEQRARYLSNDSTIASFSEPGSCYEELLKYICHIFRKVKRRTLRLYNHWQNKRRKKVDPTSAAHNGQGHRSKKRITSIHHLIHHHHHHHHHHYHLSNGSPQGPRSNPEICDLKLSVVKPRSQLTLPPPSPNLRSSMAPDSESVRSIYHTDCHVEGAGVKCKSSNIPAAIKFPNNTNMNYPTILPSPVVGKGSVTPASKGMKMGGSSGCVTPVAMVNSPAHMNVDSYEKLHHLVGEHGLCRTSSRLSGLNVPCPLPSPQSSMLNCELQNCPYCASILEDPEFEFSESDSYESGDDNTGVYEFTQDVKHGDQRDQIQQQRNKKRKKEDKKPPKERNKIVRFWKAFGEKLKRIVESKYFNRGIMIAILINTLSMGIEYHEQPDELTNALEISNIVFTSMFALEMVLKLLAFGIWGYIKNPYNIFDGIIVVISVWEIIGQSDGGLSVLRTFRLLRVLKLVRFMPALRRQLVVLMKTMDNVATFCMLLMLFIFIFSILGMHLFGCKFGLKTDTGDTMPDRKNFDTLLWAIVTVFQILTQEDWNVVLYNGMASTSSWAALYFVALMTFGNYVLFNLLVAILVEGFQAEGDANRSDTDEDKTSINFEEEMEKLKELRASEMKMYSLAVTPNGHLEGKGSMPPPIIMRTAATPMPTPKGSPHMDSMVYPFLDSRRGSNASVDPMSFDQKSLSSLRSTPCAPWGTSSNWGSRRSSWNSLGRAPSLKKKSQCGERESLLSGEGKGSTDDEAEDTKLSAAGRLPLHRRAESLDCRGALELPELLQVSGVHHPMSLSPMAVLPTEYQDCNGKMLHVPNEFYLHMDGHKDDLLDLEDELEDSYCYRIRKAFEPYKPEWCKTHEDWSLYLFSPQNRFRANCQKVIAHKMFDHVVLVFIFLNCITIALERPDIDPNSTERVFLSVSNYIFTAIFVAEMMVKVVALGFFSGEHTYLQSSWNILDGVLVFVSIIDIIVSMASAGGAKILGILRVLRLLRTLRPLRVISRAPGLKLVVETLISSLRPIGNIVLICCAFFIIFGILGVQLFKGKFYYCEGPDIRNVSTKADCKNAHYKWVRRKYNFDNLGQALMSLFVLSSKDGWVNIMYDGLDAVGVDQQPSQNHNPWMLLYFISFLLIVSFFVLNMFVGVVVENFHKCRQHQEAEEARRREEKRLRRLEKKRRKAQRRPYYADYSPVRRHIHTLCTSHYLDLFITFIIGVNVITMSMEHFNQPKSLDEALKYCNYVFTIVFVIEAVLKLVAFGFRRFFKDRWNQLDLAIVLLSIMGITLEEIEMNAALPINPTIIRIMRVLRIARVLKLLKMATGMRALLDTVVQALPQVGNLGLLFMLLFFIYAALGVELFGKLDCSEDNPCEGLSRHATFNNFGMAFLTLFRVSTGDNWNGIMKDTLRECHRDDKHCLSYLPIISPVYFVTFVLIAQFVLVNVVVAVLMKHLEESNKEAKEDAEMDAEIELEMSRGISTPVRVPESNLATPRTGLPLLVKHHALASLSCESVSLAIPDLDLLEGGAHPMAAFASFRASSHRHLLTASHNAPGGEAEDIATSLGEPQNLLTVRKISVARMHSLPNDSYMFRPVMPAKAPYPLHEAELEAYSFKSPRGSITSVRSQPVETCSSSLRVPREAFRPTTPPPHREGQGAPWKLRPPQAPPLSPSVNRLLCRQEAIQRDSLESQGADSKDSTQTEACETLQPKKLLQSTLGSPLPQHPAPMPPLPGSPPRPHTSLHRSASVRTRKHAFGQHSLPRRPSSGEGNPNGSFFESSDLADEEVSHINSSAGGWQDGVDSRERSKSPFASPVPSPVILKNGSTTSLTAGGSKEKDLKKFYSVDTRGFLAKPTWTDDHRRHSIEICPFVTDGDHGFPESSEEKKAFHVHPESEYIHGVRRKKKMSPPCISIEPPMEEEKNTSTRTKASENSLLRRRTPSCESTAYRDSSELSESQPGDPGSKGERRGAPPPTCRGEHLTIPNFSFEQSDTPNSTGSLSESGPVGSLPADSLPEDSAALELQKVDHLKPQCGPPPVQNQEVLGGTRSPLRKHGPVPVITATTTTTDGEVDEPV
ncbi:voltage-dependent T-type calcium channel subunit alpha-1H isoform X2 [Sceloporus undulatus]|uniref:voltage-dependent T-type calcium channel subunit alpha-1H isoform X2 n=1 Tax=Sceloporus undulatus TaxID=8520 RepID=UPI001C4D9B6D|nr:voltage-dependent T-type calcium channel subunit alpha-1H isoform X2 [Sceloporus undulatus]